MSIVKDAVTKAGGARVVAEAFDISRGSIYEWIVNGRVPEKRVLPLAKLTQWVFTPHQLSPTLYPNPHDGLPAHIQLKVLGKT
ncbi:YdaS family helix-turn-helix protein [Burkholderia sp. AU38729]|uniref:YdaS family helix-turn-helix protein n=1 Tax=Burkholderia sp. AU38729 TaxID=2879633 RepID=UPI001CF3E535|nr:YdaS family helix-turn-helix protein [Burkholderia sp. AU38729]MCA8065511.1 helix-turn-helix domain-containing protein [Burkholderia sp. AU38729]